MLVFLRLKRQAIQLAREVDEGTVTPADYTLLITQVWTMPRVFAVMRSVWALRMPRVPRGASSCGLLGAPPQLLT